MPHRGKPVSSSLAIIGVRGLGREIALRFAREGWRVLCAARTPSDVEKLAVEVTRAGGTGVPVACDITIPTSLERFQRESVDLVVVAQTSGLRFGALPLLKISDEELTRGFETYALGTWNLLKAFGPGLLERGQGTFLQMGTSSGIRTKEGFAALGAAQHALRALVQVAAREWRSGGVHVAYLPIDGPISQGGSRFPPGHFLTPEAIARACAYLHAQTPDAWTHELVLRPTAGEWTASS
jgi:NAD(P)-dependent dehydrogenase (short-subunit alcohol dehydrogenase family)